MGNLIVTLSDNETLLLNGLKYGFIIFLSACLVRLFFRDLINKQKKISTVFGAVAVSSGVVLIACFIMTFGICIIETPVSLTFNSGTKLRLNVVSKYISVDTQEYITETGAKDLDGNQARKMITRQSKIVCVSKGLKLSNQDCWNRVKRMSEAELIAVSIPLDDHRVTSK